MTAVPNKKYTIEEYIELIKNSDERFEYFDGDVVSMAGGKFSHGAIAANLIYTLKRSLVDRPCQVVGGDIAIKTVKAPPFRYPDVSIVCGTPIIEDHMGIEMLVNPLLICEVLSPTTREYDRDEKFMVYQAINSFQEYLLVEQTRAHVTRYLRQTDGQWLRADVIGLESAVRLESLEVTLPLAEVYSMIEFPAEESAVPPAAETR